MRRSVVQAIRWKIFSMVRIVFVPALIFVLSMAFTLVSGFAQNQKPANKGESKEQPIRVNADKLISNSEKKYAEFIGDVKAYQGDAVITSDRIRIYYEGNLLNPDKDKKSSDQTAIKRIVATGNVDFVSEQYTAKTDKMEYDFATQILVLTGDNSTITMDKNSIVGSKITYYRADGRFKVEGGPDKRINATFFSDGKVSDMLGSGESKKEN
jgi:lipopolysaccharide export system protein LptA